jgi:hypothetical protein
VRQCKIYAIGGTALAAPRCVDRMEHSKEQLEKIRQIGPFIRHAAKGKMRPDHVFSNCVRASISKSYEFCLDAHRKTTEKSAFFLVASLRSICEDLIVLSYISTLPKEERDQLTTLMMHRELAVQLDAQSKFFRTARPDQAVLGAGNSKASDFESQIREIWKKNGWPGLSSAWMPQIRQIADKNHYDLLVTLYDFLYRLTSGMVHFNPAVLIRSGWGDPPESHFSPRNFHKYSRLCPHIWLAASLLLFRAIW